MMDVGSGAQSRRNFRCRPYHWPAIVRCRWTERYRQAVRVAQRSPSSRPIAGRDRTWGDSLRDREPTLLLFHLDLLRDPGGVLCVGLRYGAAIHGLVLQRTHGCAEVEDMRLL